jgi:hypothetical protein
VAELPAFGTQRGVHLPVAVAAILSRQACDSRSQGRLVLMGAGECIESLSGPRPAPGKYAVQIGPASFSRATWRPVFLPGSVLSVAPFLEDLLVHGQVGHGSLEPGVLCREFLKSLGLAEPRATVFLTPATEGLLMCCRVA